MTNTFDRQGILDNLTAIETTAKLLVNAFVKKNNDTNLSLSGIHREELVDQTTTFLAQAQKLILNLSNTFNLTTDGFIQKLPNANSSENDQQTTSKSLASDAPFDHADDKSHLISSPSKKTFSLSSITLDVIIQNRLTPQDIFQNYPLLNDHTTPNLVSLARSLRSTANLDDLMNKAHAKILNHEEQICCNYDGVNGKLPYPRHKRMLLDFVIKLIFTERNITLDDHELHNLYLNCEKHCLTGTSLTKYRGLNIDHLSKTNRSNNEQQFVCSLFRLILPSEDIRKIISAKRDSSLEWNDNELCIYYARPIHLYWIKQKWLERFPVDSANEAEKWSQCINWAIESFLETKEPRPSKRKIKNISADDKQTESLPTLEEKCSKIERTKVNVLEYASEILGLISNENNKNLPTFERLKLLEYEVFRFYWTPNREQTWSQIIDMIHHEFSNAPNDNFRAEYAKTLFDTNNNEQNEIERLLQIKL